MNWLTDILNNFSRLFNWWFNVVPWQRALRVRAGKHVRQFGPGIHLRIPFLDKVFLQPVRDRINATYAQTLTTLDGKTITLAAGIRYRIVDLQMMYETLHQPDETIRQEVEGIMSQYVVTHSSADCTPDKVRAYTLEKVDLSKYGLECVDIFMTDFAQVKTYRLIQGAIDRYIPDELNTTREEKNSVG